MVSEDEFILDEKAARKNLKQDAVQALEEGLTVLEGVDEWTTENIEKALSTRLIDELEMKPRKAYGALRVATSGEAVSPPLFESMELLGRERTLGRIRAAQKVTPWQAEPQQ